MESILISKKRKFIQNLKFIINDCSRHFVYDNFILPNSTEICHLLFKQNWLIDLIHINISEYFVLFTQPPGTGEKKPSLVPRIPGQLSRRSICNAGK